MNIILTNPTGGEVLVNTALVRMYTCSHGKKSTLHFSSGERLEVAESLNEIELKIDFKRGFFASEAKVER